MAPFRRIAGLLFAVSLIASESGSALRDQARKAERKGDTVNAYLLYSRAAALDPTDKISWAKTLALRTRAAVAANVRPPADPAPPKFHVATAPVTPEDVEEAKVLGPPVRLQPASGTKSFNLKGDSRSIAESVLKAFGIEAIFDADFQSPPPTRFVIDDVGFDEAMTAMQAATGTFIVPVSERMALVARDTTQKRQEFEHTIAVAVPIPHPVSVQEAQELARAVQQLMEVQKFGVDSGRRMVLIRDRASKVLPALALFEDVLRYRAEVHIEVEFLEATENSSLDLGLRLPNSFLLRSATEVARTGLSLPAVARTLLQGSPARFFTVSIADTQMFASMSQGSARTLSRAEMRSTEGQAVTFHIGDKYPVLTGGYFGAPAGASGQVYTPPPSFNFEDLGLVLKVTPRVHGEDEVGLEIEAEYKVLTGQALNGIPVIANRKFTSRARLKDGEIAVISGLLQTNEARSLTGIAGLMNIPVAGALFRHDSRQKSSGQALLVLRPRIIMPSPSTFATKQVLTGPEGRPRIPL